MIKRDQYGILCQPSVYDSEYCDGGDAAARTALLAMAGSGRDQFLLPQFEVLNIGMLVRHPYQGPIFNNSNNFTRDQLVQFIAGLNKLEDKSLAKRVFWSHAKRLFFAQNTHDLKGNLKPWYKSRDPIPLSNIGQMILAAKIYWLYFLLPLCSLWLIIDILWSAFADPKGENNQILSLCDVYGKYFLKMYCFLNKDWKLAQSIYWGNEFDKKFRYQQEIYTIIVTYIESRKR